MSISPETIVYVRQQNENRRLWEGNDTKESLRSMMFAEKIEFDVQYQECFITDDLTALALEAGDVLYLATRYRLNYGDLPHDMRMIEMSVLETIAELGINPDDAVDAKIIRNSQKYPDHVMSNGRNYEQATAVCKQMWKALGGDFVWSHVWLDHLAVVLE